MKFGDFKIFARFNSSLSNGKGASQRVSHIEVKESCEEQSLLLHSDIDHRSRDDQALVFFPASTVYVVEERAV